MTLRDVGLAAVVAALAASACAREGAEPARAVGEGASASAPADTLPARFARTLVGTIGPDTVQTGLRLEEGTLNGWVEDPEEDGRGFSGPLGQAGALVLEVWNQEGASRDTLVGTLRLEAEGMALRGEIRGPGRAPLAVDLREKRVAVPSGAALVSRDVLVADSARGWEAYAQLPVLVPAAGRALAPAEAAFNEAVEDSVQGAVAEFGQYVEPPGELSSEYAGPRLSTFEQGFDVALAERGLLSLEFGVSTYEVGAAHPLYYTWTLTWDLDEGRPVELLELFRPDADPLGVLSRHARAAIERNLGEFAEAAWIEEGAGPDPGNFARWTLTPDGFRVVFDPYQVAPYAAGPQEVVIPWSELASIVDPTGPAARVAR